MLPSLRPRRLSAFLLSLILIAMLAGCGGGSSDSDNVKNVARDFAGDVHDKNWNGVCSTFSQAALAQVQAAAAALKLANCQAVIQLAYSRSGNNLQGIDRDNVKVTNIKVKGDHATADLSPSADADPMTYFVKEKGDWKIDADPPAAATTTSGAGGSGTTPGSTTGSGSKKKSSK